MTFYKGYLRNRLLHESSLVLDLGDQGSNMGQQLNGKLVTSLQELLRVLGRSNARGGAGQDDSAGRESRTLRQEADQLRYAKDQVAVCSIVSIIHAGHEGMQDLTSEDSPAGPCRS